MNRTTVKKAREDLESRIQKLAARERTAYEEYEEVRHMLRDGAYTTRRNKARDALTAAARERQQAEGLRGLLVQIEDLLSEHEELKGPANTVSATESRLELLVLEDLETRCAPPPAADRPTRRRLLEAMAQVRSRVNAARAKYEAALQTEVLRFQATAIEEEIRKLADQAVRLDKRVFK